MKDFVDLPGTARVSIPPHPAPFARPANPVCGVHISNLCQTCAARHSGFCGMLSDRLRKRLAAIAVPVVHAADHWLWDEDSTPRFVGVVRSGYLRMLRYSVDGRRLITGIAGPGAFVGETANGRCGYGLEASTPVSMCTYERGAIQRLVDEDAEFRRVVHAEQLRRLDGLHWHIWSRGILNPEERLAAFLARACDALPFQPLPGGGGVLTLDIPRADIADLLGTTRESVTRITRKWQADGLIDIPDFQHFIIHDRDRLAARGGLGPARTTAAAPAGRSMLATAISVVKAQARPRLRYL